MQRTNRTIALVVFVAGLSTCGGSGGSDGMGFAPGAGATFEVLGSIPGAGTTGVALSTQVQVRFEHPVNAVSVTPASFSVWNAERVEGDLQVAGDTVLFTPERPLAVSAEHTVRLTRAIRSTAGESLAADVELAFHTRDGSWSAPEILPGDGTLADLGGTAGGEMLALRLLPASPWSDLVVTRLVPPGTAWVADAQLFGDGSVAFARLAIDRDGWGVAVANRNIGGNSFAIWASERVGDAWSAPLEAAPLDSGFTRPELAIVSDGLALLVWRRNATGEVWARTLDGSSGWSAPTRLSAEGVPADAPVVASDGRGSAIVAWREESSRIHAARFTDTGGWSPGELVHDGFVCCVSEPVADVASGVPPAVAWSADGLLLVSRYRPDTSTWSAGEIVNGAGCSGVLDRPSLALDPADRVSVAWRCAGELWCAWKGPAESWSDPLALDATGSVSDVLLTVDPHGNTSALWTRRPGPEPTRLVTRRRTTLGAWGPELPLSDPTVCAVGPRLTRLPGGTLHAAWTVTPGCDFTQGTGARAAPFD